MPLCWHPSIVVAKVWVSASLLQFSRELNSYITSDSAVCEEHGKMPQNEREIYTVHIHTLHERGCEPLPNRAMWGMRRITDIDFENFRQNDRNDVTLYNDTYISTQGTSPKTNSCSSNPYSLSSAIPPLLTTHTPNPIVPRKSNSN